jgi:hypothetical protein
LKVLKVERARLADFFPLFLLSAFFDRVIVIDSVGIIFFREKIKCFFFYHGAESRGVFLFYLYR